MRGTSPYVDALESDATGDLPAELPPRGTLTCVTDPIALTPGRCYLGFALYKGGALADSVDSAVYFDVEVAPTESGKAPTRDWALCTLGHRWYASEAEV